MKVYQVSKYFRLLFLFNYGPALLNSAEFGSALPTEVKSGK
jgi:hypothetical protein